jgi:microcystin-dependent protein
MKKLLAALALSLLWILPAAALDDTSIPTRFQIPFGNSAGSAYIRSIPQSSQIGIENCAASLTDGFPPLTFISASGGGCPPFGQDFNGILNQLSAWARWQGASGPIVYNGTFATGIGGYPAGAILQSAKVSGSLWYNTTNANTVDPDTVGAANWIALPSIMSTGDFKWRPTEETLSGWVKANGTTIGSASSGGTQLASASTEFLFTWLWTNCANTQCPVSGGRGANAAADFAANKTITVLDLRGTGIFGMDTMGGGASTNLSGVPVTSGNATTAASVLGENLHTLTTAEIPSHYHAVYLDDPGHTHTFTKPVTLAPNFQTGAGGNAYQSQTAGQVTDANVTGITVRDTAGGAGTSDRTAVTGGGGSHNTVPRVMLGTWYLKL